MILYLDDEAVNTGIVESFAYKLLQQVKQDEKNELVHDTYDALAILIIV